MLRRTIVVSLAALALASSTAALAGNGYTVWATSWHRPSSGSVYDVLTHGVAPQKALLYVYLDRHPCKFTWASEARTDVTPFKAGQSHFESSGKALITMWVSGHFSKALNARAGTTAEPEYACSYLTTANPHGSYRLTVARRSNAYFVTN